MQKRLGRPFFLDKMLLDKTYVFFDFSNWRVTLEIYDLTTLWLYRNKSIPSHHEKYFKRIQNYPLLYKEGRLNIFKP